MQNKFLTLFPLACLAACATSNFDVETDRAKLLEINEQNRRAHFDEDVNLLFGKDGHETININRGEITINSPSQSMEQFKNYFKTVDYLTWDDLRHPIIQFSEDGSMAYMIVEKDVVVKLEEPRDSITQQQVKFAWVSIYRKIDDTWVNVCTASTNGSPVNTKE